MGNKFNRKFGERLRIARPGRRLGKKSPVRLPAAGLPGQARTGLLATLGI